MNDIDIPAALDRRNNLPGLLARAGQRLLDARNSAELLEAKKLAEAALHYAKVTQAANDTHADCLRIITRAEMRMANEIDRGQAAGEVHHHGNVQTSDITPATYDDLGIDRRRVGEWRQIRDAGEIVVEEAIQSALEDGKAPTKGSIVDHIKETTGVRKKSPPDGSDSRRERNALIAKIWKDLRQALENLAGMPLAEDAFTMIGAAKSKAAIIDDNLSPALQWLKEFADVWNRRDQAPASREEDRNDHSHPGNGSGVARP